MKATKTIKTITLLCHPYAQAWMEVNCTLRQPKSTRSLLTSDNEVCVREEVLCLHQGPGMSRVKQVKYSIGVNSDGAIHCAKETERHLSRCLPGEAAVPHARIWRPSETHGGVAENWQNAELQPGKIREEKWLALCLPTWKQMLLSTELKYNCVQRQTQNLPRTHQNEVKGDQGQSKPWTSPSCVNPNAALTFCTAASYQRGTGQNVSEMLSFSP